MANPSEEKKSFMLYNSYARQVERLEDAAAGQLIKAIFAYVNGNEMPEITDAGADMAFSFIRDQLDRDKEAYKRKCEANRQNAKLGGRPPKNQTVIEEPNGSEENPTVSEPKKPTEDQKHEKIRSVQDERFNMFWSEYPKKTGKKAAYNAWMKIKPDAEMFEKIMRAVKQSEQSEQWKKDHGQYIPNPLTWLNQGRWDDEITQMDTAPQRSPMDNPFKR